MDHTQSLNDWLAPLVEKLSIGQRKRLLQKLKRQLLSTNQQRIKAQTNPDGSPFSPRHSAVPAKGLRNKRGPMFSKLRTTKHLRSSSNAQQVTVGFKGRNSFIARQHHEGITDSSGKYPIKTIKRQLLGITPDDEQNILDIVFTHISES